MYGICYDTDYEYDEIDHLLEFITGNTDLV